MAERAHPDLAGFRDKWFGLKKSVYKQNLFRRYKFCNKYIKDKIVLDAPCGVGWGTSLLKSAHKIYGVDISEEAICYARKHFKKDNIEYKIGDMAELPFKNDFFDVVICLEGFEHVPRNIGMKFLDEAIRVLKKKGLIIMTIPILTNGRHSGNPYHLYEPAHEEIQSILNERFFFIFFDLINGPDSQIVYFVGRPK